MAREAATAADWRVYTPSVALTNADLTIIRASGLSTQSWVQRAINRALAAERQRQAGEVTP